MKRFPMAGYQARHFLWQCDGKVATITLNRPERKNPLTFESYAELRDLFRQLRQASDVKVVVIAGAGGNFCSGGDVHEIIGPLVALQEADDMGGLLDFTRMTGDLVREMRHCPQPIIAAVDGIRHAWFVRKRVKHLPESVCYTFAFVTKLGASHGLILAAKLGRHGVEFL